MEGPWLPNCYFQIYFHINMVFFVSEDLDFNILQWFFLPHVWTGPLGADAIFDRLGQTSLVSFCGNGFRTHFKAGHCPSRIICNLSNILPPRVIMQAWFDLVLASLPIISRPLTTLLRGIFWPVPVPKNKLEGFWVHDIYVSLVLIPHIYIYLIHVYPILGDFGMCAWWWNSSVVWGPC